jgi:hypothetical protein
MRLVFLLVLAGVLVTGGMVWQYQSEQTQRNAHGVHLMALNKFEPFLQPWLESHQAEFDHEFLVEYTYPTRFRKHVMQGSEKFDGFFVDAFGGSGTRLRKQDLLVAYLGGPLKLLVRRKMSSANGNIPLVDSWSRLSGEVVGIGPPNTALGMDTLSWFREEGVDEQEGPTVKVFENSVALIDALNRGDCAAVILRADLRNPPDTTAWSWYRLSGIPDENYALGLILLRGNDHGKLLRSLWRRMQPDFESYRLQKEAEMAELRKSATPASGK